MPAFTFEKISPPVRPGPTATAPEKPRGVISQVINRLTETRTKRGLREEPAVRLRDDKPT